VIGSQRGNGHIFPPRVAGKFEFADASTNRAKMMNLRWWVSAYTFIMCVLPRVSYIWLRRLQILFEGSMGF